MTEQLNPEGPRQRVLPSNKQSARQLLLGSLTLGRLQLSQCKASIVHLARGLYSLCCPEVPTDRLHLTFSNRLYRHLDPRRWCLVTLLTWLLLVVLPFSIIQGAFVLFPSFTTGIPFQSDYQMLFILIVLSPLHCIIVLRLWRGIETTFEQMKDEGLLGRNLEEIHNLERTFNKYFNSRGLNCLLILLSFFIGRWLMLSRSQHIDWWGAPRVSLVGFYVAIYLSWLIWYQLLQHNCKGILSIVLMWKVFGRGVQLNLFHEDRVYGLGNIAKLLLIAYTSTVLHGLAVISLWRGQFLTGHDLWAIIFIGSFFVIFVPVFFALPSLLLMRNMIGFKRTVRERFRHEVGWPPTDSGQLRLLGTDHIVDALPDHPFTRGMLALSGSGYLIQFVSAIVTIVQATKSQ